MLPGSTFRYGSHFWMVILNPRLSRRQPIEEAATPLPREETTPPVTKIYFGILTFHAPWRFVRGNLFSKLIGVRRILRATPHMCQSNGECKNLMLLVRFH